MMFGVIASFADATTKDIWNGLDSKAARHSKGDLAGRTP
jgi:hypothetical protein